MRRVNTVCGGERQLAVLLGALGGFLYYKYVGCVNGTCAITANPYMSTIYGVMMGGLFGAFQKR